MADLVTGQEVQILDQPISVALTGIFRTMKSLPFTLTATGIVVPAVAGRRIKVYAFCLSAGSISTAGWRSGAATMLTGLLRLAANGNITNSILPPSWLIETAVGENLTLVMGTAATMTGYVSYFDDDAV